MLTVAALAGLVLASELLRLSLPGPRELMSTHKLEFFEKRLDAYDTVVIGPSTTLRQVDPQVFDTILGANGIGSRTFNFGVPGLITPETLYLLARILELEPRRLKRVFIELREHPLGRPAQSTRTRRFISWHDMPTTWRVLGMTMTSPAGRAFEKVPQHARAFAYRFASVGRVREMLAKRLAGTAATRRRLQQGQLRASRAAIGEKQNGFVSLDEALRIEDYQTRRQLQGRQQRWLGRGDDDLLRRSGRQLLDISGAPRTDQQLNPQEAALLADIAELADGTGLELVFFLGPVGPDRRGDYFLPAAHRQGLIETFLDLDQPERYPGLFDKAVWFDEAHLNATGATLFTEALAEAFVRSVASDGGGR